jgi:hypothetical protein
MIAVNSKPDNSLQTGAPPATSLLDSSSSKNIQSTSDSAKILSPDAIRSVFSLPVEQGIFILRPDGYHLLKEAAIKVEAKPFSGMPEMIERQYSILGARSAVTVTNPVVFLVHRPAESKDKNVPSLYRLEPRARTRYITQIVQNRKGISTGMPIIGADIEEGQQVELTPGYIQFTSKAILPDGEYGLISVGLKQIAGNNHMIITKVWDFSVKAAK